MNNGDFAMFRNRPSTIQKLEQAQLLIKNVTFYSLGLSIDIESSVNEIL